MDLRPEAQRIADRLGLDPHDVRNILVCLSLTPMERLRRGLAVRRRPQ